MGKEKIEKTGEEIDKERNISERPNQDIGVYSESGLVGTIRNGVCWKESVEEDCTLPIENHREIIEKEPALRPALTANKGEELHIKITLNQGEFSDSIYPHQVEIIQFGFRDVEGKVIDSETEIRDVYFSAPNEKGAYYYLIHVIWNEDKTKRAYYAFPIRVR